MKRKKRIEDILINYFKHETIIVLDKSSSHIGHNNFDGKEETHILIKLFSKNKIKYNRLEIHRLVNKILIEEFSNGLHSLEIKIIN